MKTQKYKPAFLAGIFLAAALICISFASAISYIEKEDGTKYYQSESEIRMPIADFEKFIIIHPSSEPENPVAGMVYFDLISGKLRIYDGKKWLTLGIAIVSKEECAYEKTCGEWGECINERQSRACNIVNLDCSKSSMTQEESCAEVYKTEHEQAAQQAAKQDLATCTHSRQCGEWGDCINNEQTRQCFGVSKGCSEFEDIEKQGCSAENPFEPEIERVNEKISQGETPEQAIQETVSESTGEPVEPIVAEQAQPAEPAAAAAEPAPEEAIPEQLFDITFDIEKNSLSKSDKLVIWITLQNFGKNSIPSRLVYEVYNSSNKRVYIEEEEIRVYTEQSILKRFDNLKLDKGKYILKMKVEYAGITESFGQTFEVKGGFMRSFVSWLKEVF